MADKKISSLNLVTSLSGTDVLPIVNESETKKVTFDALRSLQKSFQVKGESIGGYNINDTIDANTPLEDIIKKILQKTIPAVYVNPNITLATDILLNQEVGTIIVPVLTPIWSQGNAGNATSYKIYKDNLILQTYSTPTEYTSSNITLTANISFKGEVFWSDGPILPDNMGNPSAGQILAGSAFTNIITINAKRKTFYICDGISSAPSTSTQIRQFSSYLGLSDGSSFTIPINSGNRRVVIAYPSSLGALSLVKDRTTGYDITGAFTPTLQTINVDGATTGNNAISYNVYTYIPSIAFPTSTYYDITI